MFNNKFALSVVIPTYNRSEKLEYTIKSLLNQQCDKSAFEIVIADDGSCDDTFLMLKQYEHLVNIQYAYQVDAGYRSASARNLGIKIAQGNICLFVDSGIILKSDCIQQHIDFHRRQKREAAVIGYTYGYTQHGETEEELMRLVDPEDANGSIARLVAAGRFLDVREKIYRRYNDCVHLLHMPWTLFWGGHLSVHRKTLLEIGLFDEQYDGNWGCEDNDLGYRLQQANREIRFCREAAVLHLPHGSNQEQKETGGYENCKYLHQKFQTPETHLFLDYYLKEITGQRDDHDVIDFDGLLINAPKAVGL